MLLPKPEEEMFTIWCTLYAKLVPAGRPRILVKHLGRKSTVKKKLQTQTLSNNAVKMKSEG